MTKAEIIEQMRHDLSQKLDDPNFSAKLIAVYRRNNMEDFHAKHLSDTQMRELNPLIRNAIYTVLLHIENESIASLSLAAMRIPDYWEDCEYVDNL